MRISKKARANFDRMLENTRRIVPEKLKENLAILSGFLGGKSTDGIENAISVSATSAWEHVHDMGWQPVGQLFMRDYEETLGFCGANNFTARMENTWNNMRVYGVEDFDLWVLVFKVEWLNAFLEKIKGGKVNDDAVTDSLRTSQAEGTGAIQPASDVASAPSA